VTPASPTSQQIDCGTGVASIVADAGDTAPSGWVIRDAATGSYHYNWKTSKSWAGTCRRLTFTLDDGGTHSAEFALK
jgi:hypothetical protein